MINTRNIETSRVKTAFRSQILRESAILIRTMQNKVADDNNLFESGTLKQSLQGHFSVGDFASGSQMSMSYLTYARFLDIRDGRRKTPKAKREGYHLYNRTIFGYLYRQTMPQLKYGFTEEAQDLTRRRIIQAMTGGPGQTPAMTLIDMA